VEDPTREFNYVFKKLTDELNLLRGKRSAITRDPVISGDGRQFLVSCCTKFGVDPESLSQLPDCGIQEQISQLINNKLDECQRYKQAMTDIGAQLKQNTSENVEEARDQILRAIDAQDGVKLIDVDRIMSQMTPVELPVDESDAGKLQMLQRTLAVVLPFDAILEQLTKVLDKHYTAFLPTSKYFPRYLDALSAMKDVVRKIPPNSIFREIYSILLKSSELFRALGISLSSASFAPECAGNQQIIATILDAQLSATAQITTLRILLEEKEQQLEQETGKVTQLEVEFTDFKKAHPG
jgi:hypothetical protein